MSEGRESSLCDKMSTDYTIYRMSPPILRKIVYCSRLVTCHLLAVTHYRSTTGELSSGWFTHVFTLILSCDACAHYARVVERHPTNTFSEQQRGISYKWSCIHNQTLSPNSVRPSNRDRQTVLYRLKVLDILEGLTKAFPEMGLTFREQSVFC